MQKELFKKVGIIILVGVICLMPHFQVMAEEHHTGYVTVFKSFADSNEWSYMCYATQSTKSTDLNIKVGYIYKADGSDSNYKRVKVNPVIGQVAQGSKTVYINKNYYYDIPTAYQAAGNKYVLFAMGNNPSLDCWISGFFSGKNFGE